MLAECGYPGGGTGPHGADPHVFVFDIDACGFATLAGAAVLDSLGQAAAAWRQGKGDTAGDARPELVTKYAQLDCLVHCELGPQGPFHQPGIAPALYRVHAIRERLRLPAN